MLTDQQLYKYADILLWGLKTARKGAFKKNDVILLQYDPAAVGLAEILFEKILDLGMNPVQRMGLTFGMEQRFYRKANGRQLMFRAPGEKELCENQFDLIHVETSYVMQNIPATEIPIVLVEHNVEYLVYKRFVEKAPLLLRPFLNIDVLKLKHWEEAMWTKATKLVSVSETEKEIMSKIRKDVVIVSNGVDIKQFTINNLQLTKNKKEKRILFIGEFKWMQNRDAIEWIIKEIWPKLRAEFIPSMENEGVKLWVVGRSIPDSIRKLTSDRDVVFDDQAPKETEEIFKKSDLLLAPIRVGGGTSFKILEAMASGVPVITTELGNAMEAKEGSEIVVAKSAQDFVFKIKKLLEDKEFYESISRNGRKLIENKFNWEKIANDLDLVYESVLPYA